MNFWKNKNGLALSAGAGVLPFPGSGAITIPFGLRYLHGEKYCYELGVGITPIVFTSKNSSDTEWPLHLLIGCRSFFLDGSLIGRIFFSPFIVKKESVFASNLDMKGNFIPYGGLSLGIIIK